MAITTLDVVNMALSEIGWRNPINSFNEVSPAAQVAKLQFSPKIEMLMRGAPWNFCRHQILGTVLKASVIDGVTSDNPPPQPWNYEYAWPSDALRVRFMIPYNTTTTSGTPLTTNQTSLMVSPAYANTKIPFVVSTDYDACIERNPPLIKVILTNLQNAIFVYTKDLSQRPDLWDKMFLSAATATLGAYFINALARNKQQMDDQIAIAKGALDAARGMNGSEALATTEHLPDWYTVRTGGYGSGYNTMNGNMAGADWDMCGFPGGLFY